MPRPDWNSDFHYSLAPGTCLEIVELPVRGRVDEPLCLLVDLVLLLLIDRALVEELVHQLLNGVVVDGIRLRLKGCFARRDPSEFLGNVFRHFFRIASTG